MVPGAEFDHVFDRSLNKAEHGWLICAACHGALTHIGYLHPLMWVPKFRAPQGAVFGYQRRERTAAGDQVT